MEASRESSSPGARQAMSRLCELYWPPLYAYARRQGQSVDEAQDLTQGFFARFLEKHDVKAADPLRGKFRSFLLTSFKHFMANERDRQRTKKRGGDQIVLSLEFDTAEARYKAEPTDRLTPEALFERQWALGILERAMTALSSEAAAAGKGRLFDAAKDLLSGERDKGAYAQLASTLGMSEGAVRVTIHRLRRRLRELLRAEIAITVERDSEIDEEIRFLTAVLQP
jgi:RNA polymerase sigma factor (sigma-70 family)